MNSKHIEAGNIGENLACGYLVKKGYQIIERNYREKFGEIDIIAKSQDKILVFIEVKTISVQKTSVDKSLASYPHLAKLIPKDLPEKYSPEDHLTYSKMKRFRKISEWYANQHPELVEDKGYRLDVIAIQIDGKKVAIKHYLNV
jgi:Holliday junction resolvase-like predicted endonuclease